MPVAHRTLPPAPQPPPTPTGSSLALSLATLPFLALLLATVALLFQPRHQIVVVVVFILLVISFLVRPGIGGQEQRTAAWLANPELRDEAGRLLADRKLQLEVPGALAPRAGPKN